MDAAPWSQNQLRKLGRHIRGGELAQADLPAYEDVVIWHNDLAAAVQRRLEKHDWSRAIPGRKPKITSRAKTIDTLRQKLQRDPATPLSSVQDIAGVRLEVEMTLDEQDDVATEVCALFGHDPENAIHDMRSAGHRGYRAFHVWLRLEGRVELQIRTHLQGLWANAYESVGDAFGRGVRYGELPVDPDEARLVEAMQSVSTQQIASLESSNNDIQRLKLDYARRIHLLGEFAPDETLPREIVEAQEAAARIADLELEVKDSDRMLSQMLRDLKMTFDRMEGVT